MEPYRGPHALLYRPAGRRMWWGAVRADGPVFLTVPRSPLAGERSCGNGLPHGASVGIHGPWETCSTVRPSAGRVHTISRHHLFYKPLSPVFHTLGKVEVKSF